METGGPENHPCVLKAVGGVWVPQRIECEVRKEKAWIGTLWNIRIRG